MLDFLGYVTYIYVDLISVPLDEFLMDFPLFCLHHMAGCQMISGLIVGETNIPQLIFTDTSIVIFRYLMCINGFGNLAV
jgi:hypothetical protein